MQILVVDDHILFREGITSLLNKQPDLTIVGGASSVEEAITQAYHLHPDVILIDFTLSNGSSFDLTRAILAKVPSAKIVFLTVDNEDERLFQAIRHGAKGYLLKNTPIIQFLAYLRGLKQDKTIIPHSDTSPIAEEFVQFPFPEEVER